MKKVLKMFIFCLMSIIVFTCSACGCRANNNSIDNIPEDDPQPPVDQNVYIDTTETYDSILTATNTAGEKLTDDQKNSFLPLGNYVNNIYSITAPGNYYYYGELEEKIVVAKNVGHVHLYLEDILLSVEDDSVISSKTGSYVTISLIGINNISNTLGSESKNKNVIDCKENLVINGNGILTINSTKSAIACDKIFYGLGGTINATTVKRVVTADSIYFDGMTINAVSVGDDILHAESDYDAVAVAPEFDYKKGFIYAKSGTINAISVYGDGIQADSFVYITGGTYNITTIPTWNNNFVAENQNKSLYDATTHQKVSKDDVRAGRTYAELEKSVKGIRVGEIDYYLDTDTNQENELVVEIENYAIIIEGGTFNITTVDDGIHANSGSIIVSGGEITISTVDDGIRAEKNLIIKDNANINVIKCFEGIEAEVIEISGGTTKIVALDDGVNASNVNLPFEIQKLVCQLNIYGGRLDVATNSGGNVDGIDSNGRITITGGVVITRGPDSPVNCPLDAANEILVAGGIVIAIGFPPEDVGASTGLSEGELFTISDDMVKTQFDSKGFASGNHTVVIGDTTIEFYNNYTYGGYTTIYASQTATLD